MLAIFYGGYYMDINSKSDALSSLICRARTCARRNAPVSDKFSVIQQELRLRRRAFLGAYISMRDLVRTNHRINEDAAQVLAHYLAARTVPFWEHSAPDAEEFCFRFYQLAIYALAGGRVAGERVDDILQLAECIVRSRKVFVIAMKSMLPADMIGELFDFNEAYDEKYTTPAFEDAALAGVCVFLGVLADPLQPADAETGEEE